MRTLALPQDQAELLRMRMGLYEDDNEAEMLAEIQEFLTDSAPHVVLVAERPSGTLAGFAEVGIRKYAEGCTTSPVAYLEGWYVDADIRQQGVGRMLIAAAEAWARQNGYQELASDTLLTNSTSLAAHLAVGFTEVERQICFIKKV